MGVAASHGKRTSGLPSGSRFSTTEGIEAMTDNVIGTTIVILLALAIWGGIAVSNSGQNVEDAMDAACEENTECARIETLCGDNAACWIAEFSKL
jgi:hypothetical protein